MEQLEQKKQKLCRDFCKALVQYKNEWIKSSTLLSAQIGHDPTFKEFKKCLKCMGMSKVKASLKKPDHVPGYRQYKPEHWNYARNLNMDEHPVIASARLKELESIQNFQDNPSNAISPITITYLSNFNGSDPHQIRAQHHQQLPTLSPPLFQSNIKNQTTSQNGAASKSSASFPNPLPNYHRSDITIAAAFNHVDTDCKFDTKRSLNIALNHTKYAPKAKPKQQLPSTTALLKQRSFIDKMEQIDPQINEAEGPYVVDTKGALNETGVAVTSLSDINHEGHRKFASNVCNYYIFLFFCVKFIDCSY